MFESVDFVSDKKTQFDALNSFNLTNTQLKKPTKQFTQTKFDYKLQFDQY